MKKKRRLNPKLKFPLIIVAGVAVIVFIIVSISSLSNTNTVKSVHSDARKYKANSCTVFYPASAYGKEYAESICAKNYTEDAVYDYSLVPYGDNYLVDYGSGLNYLADSKYNLLKIDSIKEEGKFILSDYLRYSMKKDEKDEAYTLDFINDTYYENLDISGCTYTIASSYLDVYFPQYDYTVSIPLKYISQYLDVDLGVSEEDYVKPNYVSAKRKTICLTFNDGPSISTSGKVVDTLYKYDAVGTFFVIGDNLDASTIDIVEDAIAKGNQIGSLTETGYNLYLAESDEDVVNEIMGPANELFSGKTGSFAGLGYSVSIYRAPGGDHKKYDDIAPLMAIEWDLDVDNYDDADVETNLANIENFRSKNPDELNECILKFRDNKASCAETLDELIPELINDGYQIVTVAELLDQLGMEVKAGTYYPW